jgi:hypothetical protein
MPTSTLVTCVKAQSPIALVVVGVALTQRAPDSRDWLNSLAFVKQGRAN